MSSIAYRIVSQLAANKSALLYRAIRDDNNTEVDVLVLSDADSPETRRIAKRLAIAGKLDHPAAAKILDASVDIEHPTYVLELIAKGSLRQVVASASEEDKRNVLTHGCQIASLLAAAHRLGLVHGCLSPESVRVGGDGSLQIDFIRAWLSGEASNDDSPCTKFCAPEIQRASDADAAADVYSLASLVVWLFAGTDSEANPASMLPEFRQRLGKWFVGSSSDVDAVCDAVQDGLSLDPADRSTAQSIFSTLQRLVAGAEAEQKLAPQPDPTLDGLDVTDDFDFAKHVSTSGPASLRSGDSIGRYLIRRKIGEGGMGSVFEAVDTSDESVVAIKVLAASILHKPDAVRRFHKEARMLGEIKSPFVTNLLEVNEDGGQHYLVMEYVAGIDLRRMIQKSSPMDERVALSIIADAARGLISAHQQNIIHRDIKPANILMAYSSVEDGLEEHLANLSLDTLENFHVKLSDFGLARHMEQSESMEMTRVGGVVGTPAYMSPEQFSDQHKVSPATDVYAMGITLFEMLAGKPPFVSSDLMHLISLHSQPPPKPLEKLNPDVSQATCEIVHRAMAKNPQDRYADAGQFLRDVERRLRGEATNISVHPETPPSDDGQKFEEVFQWKLKSSPADLWPYVSNTERINAAVGLPSVHYQTERDDQGRLRKFGAFRLAGLQIGWEEHPFEWVEGQRLGILREFQQGPFVWFMSIVQLLPESDGGTLLTHTVRIKPRGIVGRLVAALEVRLKGKRNLDRVYRRIDESVTGRLAASTDIDPFSEPEKLSGARRKRLDQRLDNLTHRGVDPNVIECLAGFLGEAPSQELARIRPLALARNFSLDADRTISGCLAAAKEGLLNLHWDILCPTCRISSQVVDTLQEIKNHARCEVCDLDFELDLANSVEMIFRVHPEIREADIGTYCIGGPEHSPHVVLQLRLAAGKRVELAPLLSEGEYVLRSAQLTYNYPIRALATKGTTHTEIVLSPEFDPGLVSQVRAGRNVITITNNYDHELVIRLERSTRPKDVFTAAQASVLPEFRELFPNETPRLGQLINVNTVTLLAADITDSENLFSELGDGDTFSVVRSFHELLERIAKHHAGSKIKVLGTEVLFAFETPVDVIQAIVEFSEALREHPNLDLRFCAAVHRGTALVTSSDGKLDYFGGTVHLVGRMLRIAAAGELLMTETVAADPLVVSAILEKRLRSEFCDLPQFGSHGSRCQRLSID